MTGTNLLANLDGDLLDPTVPIVRADDLGVVRGDGVFDAMLAIGGTAVDRDAHLDRLERSAAMLALPRPDRSGYERAIDALLAAWPWETHPEAMLRLVQTRGPEGLDLPGGWVMAEPMAPAAIRQRREGVRVLALDRGFDGGEVAAMPWLLPGAKTLSYGINMAAKRYALANGADDVVFVSPGGAVLEGPTSTVLVDRDGELLTPPQDGILPSITLERLFEVGPPAGLPVRFEALRLDELRAARGVWLLSSGRVLAPVTAIDGEPVPRSPLHARIATLLGVPTSVE
ncbi:4-amino-4-deoxychorismate lyase [Pseudoclavibacter chungangensis]|uniref:4-amino-4-deoxychorismate lyase n=1 Tax=Pseudoclavibacter chungangensis TaxID=587635 RepID=A0A7J5BTD6_9MICO|nr:aminotransferase class IV [Pseudoclavibacter chungangensis]KAB1656807.1 4-amino-4-deoxychorismate lyase [Pseudoclavibacter chungangensis]NYJ67257.1 4-amino-4-deoxychorismate lyase [Pseudoclavibacter chungangensis]